MTTRLPIPKTYKLFINGQFPRTESGRSVKIAGAAGNTVAHTCHASRKDLRNAVEAAAGAQAKWAGATAYLRAQILYRLAEMMEGKAGELAEAHRLEAGAAGTHGSESRATLEVAAAIDRIIHYAGWADKYPQVLGCANPVAGPYHNFTVPEPVGVVGIVCPDDHPLLALVSLVAPVVCAGNACVVLASETNPIPACILAEAIATSDMPGGVINILTGFRDELVPHFASHREIAAIHAAGVTPEQRKTLELGAAENLKRVTVRSSDGATKRRSDEGGFDWFDDERCEGPQWIEPFVEFKTIWHPSSA
ncbi:MAG: aldehyde dehydrogenase family protein [Phycisphaerales bacterium]|nr:aldehyde dehydrogenase family protein [Phycisphaerales bacterium]